MAIYEYWVVDLQVVLVGLVDHKELGLLIGQSYTILVTVVLGEGENIGQINTVSSARPTAEITWESPRSIPCSDLCAEVRFSLL